MSMQDYMLTDANMDKAIIHIRTPNSVQRSKIVKSVKSPKTCNTNDPLFWLFYKIKHELPDRMNIVVEKQLKIDFVEQLRTTKSVAKLASISHVESNLVNDTRIDRKTFLTLCELEDLNVLFIVGRTYYELMSSLDTDIHVIYKSNYDQYSYQLNPDVNKELLCNVNKPLKSISVYKLGELETICSQLGVEVVGKRTKAVLYQAISSELDKNIS
jgi:hypothetical protein